MSACSKETLHDTTSEPMLEPNSAATQLPAAYGFGFRITPPSRSQLSSWGEQVSRDEDTCINTNACVAPDFEPIVFLLSWQGSVWHWHLMVLQLVSVNTSARPMKSCTCRKAPFARWFHGENTYKNGAKMCRIPPGFDGFMVSTTSSHLYSFSLSLSLSPSLHLQLTSSSHVFRYMLFTTSIQFTLLYICLLPECAAYWIICHT